MKKYCITEDIKKTCSELKANIRRRERVSPEQVKLLKVIDDETQNICSEVVSMFQIFISDHDKGLISEEDCRKTIDLVKELFEYRRYYLHYSRSLMEIKNQIENKIAA